MSCWCYYLEAFNGPVLHTVYLWGGCYQTELGGQNGAHQFHSRVVKPFRKPQRALHFQGNCWDKVYDAATAPASQDTVLRGSLLRKVYFGVQGLVHNLLKLQHLTAEALCQGLRVSSSFLAREQAHLPQWSLVQSFISKRPLSLHSHLIFLNNGLGKGIFPP